MSDILRLVRDLEPLCFCSSSIKWLNVVVSLFLNVSTPYVGCHFHYKSPIPPLSLLPYVGTEPLTRGTRKSRPYTFCQTYDGSRATSFCVIHDFESLPFLSQTEYASLLYPFIGLYESKVCIDTSQLITVHDRCLYLLCKEGSSSNL